MINGHPMGVSVNWSMEDRDLLDKLIGDSNITVSLLPYRFHADIAKVCLLHRKPLVTTSYVQPAIQEMHESARKAGVIMLNEIGLDPGIDHMTAIRIIDHIHSQGGKVEEFYSMCGALPAPEAATNPMKYKFSWSPQGVILASRNSAQYLKKGKKVIIESENLFKDRFDYNFEGVGNLEVYPNRDSISYIDIYGIPEVQTIYRGTFRFKGWCETLDVIKNLRLLDDDIKVFDGISYAQFLASQSGTQVSDLKKNIARKLGIKESSIAIESLDFLGFFSNDILPYQKATPLEVTSDRMISLMQLADSERDMVVLQHIFLAVYPDGRKEVIKSSMLDFGTPLTNTSIARTVALPAAIAVKLILEKKINLSGVYRPVIPEIYNPVLMELKNLGIEMKEEYGLGENEMLR